MLVCCAHADRTDSAGPASCRDHRCRRDRDRAFRRIAQDRARSRGLWSRQDRSRQRYQDNSDRSCRPHRSDAAEAFVGFHREAARRLGVEVRTGARVTEVRRDGVQLADGQFIPSELVVWSAGVRGPDVLRNLDGLETSRASQLVVRPTLQTTRDDNIFAIGDCAYLVRGRKAQPIPPRAQAAHQQASHLLKQIRRRLAGQPVEPFRYRDFGSLVSLGEFSTIGSLMGFVAGKGMLVEGYVARLDVSVALQDA